MHSRRLGESELEEFRQKFQNHSGNAVDQRYLRGAFVRGFFDDAGLVAGYAINTTAPLRYFEWIPSSENGRPAVRRVFGADDAVEITCIWGDPSRIGRLQRRVVYWMCMCDAWATGRNWVVGGSVVPKVAKVHRQVLPSLIYLGPTTLPGSPDGQLYCARRAQLFLTIPLGFAWDIAWTCLNMAVKRMRRGSGRGPAETGAAR